MVWTRRYCLNWSRSRSSERKKNNPPESVSLFAVTARLHIQDISFSQEKHARMSKVVRSRSSVLYENFDTRIILCNQKKWQFHPEQTALDPHPPKLTQHLNSNPTSWWRHRSISRWLIAQLEHVGPENMSGKVSRAHWPVRGIWYNVPTSVTYSCDGSRAPQQGSEIFFRRQQQLAYIIYQRSAVEYCLRPGTSSALPPPPATTKFQNCLTQQALPSHAYPQYYITRPSSSSLPSYVHKTAE
jgi:hypothetical protein